MASLQPLYQAANPRPHRPPRYWLALALGGAVVAAMLVGSIIDLVALRSTIVLLDLLGVVIVGLITFGTWLVIVGVDRRPDIRRRHLVVAGIALSLALGIWLLGVNLLYAGLNFAGVLLSLPTTGLALYLIRRLDYNEREPWRLILVAAGWGAVVATTLAIIFEAMWSFSIDGGLIPGPGLQVSTAFSAALLEETPKGVAVLLLFLVMRNEFDDVVDGIVYGAAVGLGFNFMETVVYMSVGGFGQWIFRQWLGLFLGHATYTALIGAGIGIARQVPGLGRKALTILSGFIIAVAAHFAWDAWIWYFPRPSDPGLLLLSIPAQYLAVDGPFFIAVAAMFILGLRIEGRALARELASEAATGSGAVLPQEVPVLVSPARRFEARMRMLSSRGLQGYLWLRRLQRAQLDLVLERWHRARLEIDEPLEAELRLRDKVLAIRYGVRT